MSKLHPRNPHQDRYNIDLLCQATPGLKPFVTKNPRGEDTIDFSDAKAVLALNKALLAHHYGVHHWSIPDGFLCPPIPGRADYIHYAADLLASDNNGKVPVGKKVRVLDVGTGANLVYPIIGSQTYGWQFSGSEINPESYRAAAANITQNPNLVSKIKLVEQTDASSIFKGVIQPNDRFSFTMCNPPFHKSAADAAAGSQRKNRNLNKGKAVQESTLNFGGQRSELWCEGGELAFIGNMIEQSKLFRNNVCWFTCLVSKQDHLSVVKRMLKKCKPTDVRIIDMAQGQKVSRFVAWTFLTEQSRHDWFKK